MRNKLIRGMPGSPGIVIGKAVHYRSEKHAILIPINRKRVSRAEGLEVKGNEVKKFESALNEVRCELELIRENFLSQTDEYHARILDAELLVLDDETLMKNTINRIKKGETALESFKGAMDQALKGFERVKDKYIRERVADIRDVAERVLHNLRGQSRKLPLRKEKHILIATDLVPSDTARLDKSMVMGFATDLGGETSHTSMMARALEIPAVVGLKEITKFIEPGEEVIIDGNHGVVVIDPDDRTRRAYEKRIREFQEYEKELLFLANLPCETIDGHAIELACNIEIPEELDAALTYGTSGIGLMRTEFLYLEKLPKEEEQYKIYSSFAKKVHPNSLIIRTLDIGGDKLIGTGLNPVPISETRDANPFLGWRGIRFSLARRDIFITQLKAILRANKKGNVKLMFPMIEGIREVIEAKQCVEEAKKELAQEGKNPGRDMEIGVMIEVPSAALIAETIAREVDFFSIGSNDLTQYTLACDRGNLKVQDYYNPFHPAVLKLIKGTIDGAHSVRKWVGCCGEFGNHPVAIPILIGLGIDELSVAPLYLLEVKKIIRALSMEEARTIANKVLSLETEEEVKRYVGKIKETIPVIREIMGKYEE